MSRTDKLADKLAAELWAAINDGDDIGAWAAIGAVAQAFAILSTKCGMEGLPTREGIFDQAYGALDNL